MMPVFGRLPIRTLVVVVGVPCDRLVLTTNGSKRPIHWQDQLQVTCRGIRLWLLLNRSNQSTVAVLSPLDSKTGGLVVCVLCRIAAPSRACIFPRSARLGLVSLAIFVPFKGFVATAFR